MTELNDVFFSPYLLSSPFSIVLVFLVSIVATYFFLFHHRRNWPNSPPGPVGWPILGYMPYLTGRLNHDFFHLAKIYGPLFSIRIGQRPFLVVSSPEMAREVFLKQNDSVFSNPWLTEATRTIAYDGTTLVFVPYGARWRLLRKIMTTEIFSSRAMDFFQPVREQQVQGLLATLYAATKSETAVNVADSIFALQCNILSNLICSKTLFDDTTKGREIKEMVDGVFAVIGTPSIVDMIPFLKVFGLQHRLKKKLFNLVKRLDDFFEKLIEERLEKKKNGLKMNDHENLDLLDVFLDYKIDNKEDKLQNLSRVDIKGLLMDMFLAGADPLSTTIEWGMAEILKNPDVYKRILEELDQVVGRNRYVKEIDIPKLTYLQAVVKEVFRLHQTAPISIPRCTNAASEVFGYHVPKNAIVVVNVWGIARDPKLWNDPNEFKPERFIGSDIDVKGQHFELLPFGTGSRSCVALPLAHRLVHYVLASLLHAYEWNIPTDILEDTTEYGNSLRKAKALAGVPKPRLSQYI